MLHCRIVYGIQGNKQINQKLLAKSQLALTRAAEITMTMEMAETDESNLRMSPGLSKKSSGNRSKSQNPRVASQNTLTSSTEKYNWCGEADLLRELIFKSLTCHCSKKIGPHRESAPININTHGIRIHNLKVKNVKIKCQCRIHYSRKQGRRSPSFK